MLLGDCWKSGSNRLLAPQAQKRKGNDNQLPGLPGRISGKSFPNLMPQIAARFTVDFPPGGDQTLPANYNYKVEMEEVLKLMIINEQKTTWPNEYDQLQEGNGCIEKLSPLIVTHNCEN